MRMLFAGADWRDGFTLPVEVGSVWVECRQERLSDVDVQAYRQAADMDPVFWRV